MVGEKLKIIRKKKPVSISTAPNVNSDFGGKPLPNSQDLFAQGGALAVPQNRNAQKVAPPVITKTSQIELQPQNSQKIRIDPVNDVQPRDYQTQEPPLPEPDKTVLSAELAIDPELQAKTFEADIAISKKESNEIQMRSESSRKKEIEDGKLELLKYLRNYFQGAAGTSNFGGDGSSSYPGDLGNAPAPPGSNTPMPPSIPPNSDGIGSNTPAPPPDSGAGIGQPSNTPAPPKKDKRREEYVGVGNDGIFDIIFGRGPPPPDMRFRGERDRA